MPDLYKIIDYFFHNETSAIILGEQHERLNIEAFPVV